MFFEIDTVIVLQKHHSTGHDKGIILIQEQVVIYWLSIV